MMSEKGVLVALITRPKHQARKLCEKIEDLGGKTFLFPTVEIISYRGSVELKKAVEKIADYSWALFTSANAVDAAGELWNQYKISVPVIAIGTGTANALASYRIPVAFVPAEFSSAGILKLSELQELENKKIAIFCGENAKPELKSGLSERGALITEVHCYRRERPSLSRETQIPEATRQAITVIVSTSRESLLNLHALFSPNDLEWLLDKPIIVISPEMLQFSRELGWRQGIYVAKNPSDEAIVEALSNVQCN